MSDDSEPNWAKVVELDYDPTTEDERRKRNRERFDRLSERPPGRDNDS